MKVKMCFNLTNCIIPILDCVTYPCRFLQYCRTPPGNIYRYLALEIRVCIWVEWRRCWMNLLDWAVTFHGDFLQTFLSFLTHALNIINPSKDFLYHSLERKKLEIRNFNTKHEWVNLSKSILSTISAKQIMIKIPELITHKEFSMIFRLSSIYEGKYS